MRMVLSCAIVLAIVAPAIAQKKGNKDKAVAIDVDKLVGKWEPVPIKGIKGPKGPVREFTKDGKCSLASPPGKNAVRIDGTYKLDGVNLTITYTLRGGFSEEHKYKFKKLTDTDLILVEGKLTEAWKRVK